MCRLWLLRGCGRCFSAGSLLSEDKMLSVPFVSASALVSSASSFIVVGACRNSKASAYCQHQKHHSCNYLFFHKPSTSFVASLYVKPLKTAKVGISALTGICRYSFSRIVTGSIKGERCGEGEAAAVAIHHAAKGHTLQK